MRSLFNFRPMGAWALLGLLLLAAAGMVQAQEQQRTSDSRDCADCHLDVAATWQMSTHSLSFLQESFQTAWTEAGSLNTCLNCHTTGFDRRTGTYHDVNIGCTACHGLTPDDHPGGAPFDASVTVEVCADCHANSYAEWRVSPHSEQEQACATCHEPHSQHLVTETARDLCLSCHQVENLTSYVHQSHPEQVCADCHWYHNPDKSLHLRTGELFYTGHDDVVKVVSCSECHQETHASANELITLRADSPNPQQQEPPGFSSVQLLLGSFIGFSTAFFGLMVIFSRRRR